MLPWCNGYRRRKWTRRHEFKSWTRLIAFHIALIPLGKVWNQLFFLQLWVNNRADCVLLLWLGNQSRRRKTEFQPNKLRLKIDLVSYPARAEELRSHSSSLPTTPNAMGIPLPTKVTWMVMNVNIIIFLIFLYITEETKETFFLNQFLQAPELIISLRVRLRIHWLNTQHWCKGGGVLSMSLNCVW